MVGLMNTSPINLQINQYTYKYKGKVFITFASSIEEADVILLEKTGVQPKQTSCEIEFNINHHGKGIKFPGEKK